MEHTPAAAPVDLAPVDTNEEFVEVEITRVQSVINGVTRMISPIFTTPENADAGRSFLTANVVKNPILRVASNVRSVLRTSTIGFARGADGASLKDGLASRYIGYAGTEKMMKAILGTLSELVAIIPGIFHTASLTANSRQDAYRNAINTYNTVYRALGECPAGQVTAGIAVAARGLATVISSIAALGEIALNSALIITSKVTSLLVGALVHLVALSIVYGAIGLGYAATGLGYGAVATAALVTSPIYLVLRLIRAIKEYQSLSISQGDQYRVKAAYDALKKELRSGDIAIGLDDYLYTQYDGDLTTVAINADAQTEVANARVLGNAVPTHRVEKAIKDIKDTFKFFKGSEVDYTSDALQFIKETSIEELAEIVRTYNPKGASEENTYKIRAMHIARLAAIKDLENLEGNAYQQCRIIIRALSQSDKELLKLYDLHTQEDQESIVGRVVVHSQNFLQAAAARHVIQQDEVDEALDAVTAAVAAIADLEAEFQAELAAEAAEVAEREAEFQAELAAEAAEVAEREAEAQAALDAELAEAWEEVEASGDVDANMEHEEQALELADHPTLSALDVVTAAEAAGIDTEGAGANQAPKLQSLVDPAL